MNKLAILSALAGLGLACGSASALSPLAPTATNPSVITLVPGTAPVSAGGFLNVRRLFDLYGHLITKLPQFSTIEQLVAAGFPDPRTDINELGLVSDLDSRDASVAAVITGNNLSQERVMAAAQALGITFENSAYRGVNLFTTQVARRSAQLGFVDGKLVLSVNDSGKHELSKATIETVAGSRQHFGAANNVTLDPNYILNISLQLTKSVKDLLRYAGELGLALQKSTLLSASLTADAATKDAHLAVTFRMTEDDAADKLATALKNLIADFEQHATPRDREIFRSITYNRDGQTLVLQVTITEAAMQRWVSGSR